MIPPFTGEVRRRGNYFPFDQFFIEGAEKNVVEFVCNFQRIDAMRDRSDLKGDGKIRQSFTHFFTKTFFNDRFDLQNIRAMLRPIDGDAD